jgi:hypothetical protein
VISAIGPAYAVGQQPTELNVSPSEDDEGVESTHEPAGCGEGRTCVSEGGTDRVSALPGRADGVDDESFDPAGLRHEQEREIRTRHSIVELEIALATDAVHVGRALAQAGLAFDPLTFIASRILEVALTEDADPHGLLAWLVEDGSIDRSVELAVEGLDGDPSVSA